MTPLYTNEPLYTNKCYMSFIVWIWIIFFMDESIWIVPLLLPQAKEHFYIVLFLVNLKLLNLVWQLHIIIFKSLAGAGAKSVNTGVIHCLSPYTWLHFTAFTFHSLFGSIHRTCNILQQVQKGDRVYERTVVHGTCSS